MFEERSPEMEWLWKHFTCQKCGCCCRQIGLPWDAERLKDIATFLGMTKRRVIEKYYRTIVVKNGKMAIKFDDTKQTPCQFLQPDNSCGIYELRPEGCRLYPVETDGGPQGVDCPGLKIPE